jgi:hypothetical protein
MKMHQVEELVLQSLEHEQGGVKVYITALTCAVNAGLKKEWEKYLGETRTHVTALEAICQAMEIDAAKETPARAVVRHTGAGLVVAMKMALAAGDAAAGGARRLRVRRLRRDQGPRQLGASWQVRRAPHRPKGRGAQGSVRDHRRPRRRAPLPHQSMVP